MFRLTNNRLNQRLFLRTCLVQSATGRRPSRSHYVFINSAGWTYPVSCRLNHRVFYPWICLRDTIVFIIRRINQKSNGYRKIKAGVKERERARKTFSDVARKTCSHTRTQWRKSLTWMIAADQLVGREVSFSKSGFQFPKGAYRVPTESPLSEFASSYGPSWIS